ncbi:MAG TPA: CmcJ/NvfI family oxidoreductase [Allosphingosinicella sp.]|nr:CmcJ/NvfI family oxidoreductase [Allosphingosinicella sp.]
MNAQTAIRALFAPPFGAVTLAPLNFLKPMQERLVSYQYDPPPGIPQRNGEDEPHLVAIADARPLAADLSLDAEGFELLQAASAFASFDDNDAIRTAYYAEVEALLADATGAQKVIAFDHNVRSMARAAGGEAGIRGPVPRTHNDFTARSGPERAAAELAARGIDPLALEGRRFAIINLWRPIGRAVEKSPLALADARSIAPGDWVETDLVYRDRVGETYALGYSAGQLWYWFPRLAPDEAILIKGFDSAPDVARFTPHSAFDDPAARADAPARESIEVRALVIY